MLIRCNKNKEYEVMFESPVVFPCLRDLEVTAEEVFAYGGMDYDDEVIYQYYAVCPYCHNFILIPSELLSEEEKMAAIQRREEDIYSYQKNLLKAKLWYYEELGKKRVRSR